MSNTSKIVKGIQRLFTLQFKTTRDTGIAFLSGLLVIITSLCLFMFHGGSMVDKAGSFIFRDLIMIFGIGFAFPLYYILIVKKESLENLGITRYKWPVSIVLNIIFAIFLLFQFIGESGAAGNEVLLRPEALIPIFYIFVAGIFEMIFFYGFLCHQFEKAFGIIPGILLVALFYSLHHAGFQPEFVKLFFVGMLYASVFRITKNILIIFPFFWGVGAVWDVLVSFGAGEQLQGLWTLTRTVSVLGIMFLFSMYLKYRIDKGRIKKC